jgi:hypothetical protein
MGERGEGLVHRKGTEGEIGEPRGQGILKHVP